ADNLDTGRQAAGGKAGRDSDRGLAGEVERIGERRPGQAQRRAARNGLRAVTAERESLTSHRRGNEYVAVAYVGPELCGECVPPRAGPGEISSGHGQSAPDNRGIPRVEIVLYGGKIIVAGSRVPGRQDVHDRIRVSQAARQLDQFVALLPEGIDRDQ